MVLTFILLAVSLASRMNCLESSLRTTISPDFWTVLKASAVLWSYLFSTVSICRKISLEIPLTCQENISQLLSRRRLISLFTFLEKSWPAMREVLLSCWSGGGAMLVAGLGGARGCLEGVFWADFRSLPPLSW